MQNASSPATTMAGTSGPSSKAADGLTPRIQAPEAPYAETPEADRQQDPFNPDQSKHAPVMPMWNANSYFAPRPPPLRGNEARADSPSEAAKGARTGAELLRRLSLVDIAQTEIFDIDPRASHPGL